MLKDYDEAVRVLKAFSDERRLKILALMRDGEKCICKLTEEMNMPQSSLSYHMKVLCEAGIIEGIENGKWTHYHISKKGCDKAIELLREATEENGPGEKCIDCCKGKENCTK